MSAESLLESSPRQILQEYVELDQKTQDEVSSIYTYEYMNYEFPWPRAGKDGQPGIDEHFTELKTSDLSVNLLDGDVTFDSEDSDEANKGENEKDTKEEKDQPKPSQPAKIVKKEDKKEQRKSDKKVEKLKDDVPVKISDDERARVLGKAVKPSLLKVARIMKGAMNRLRSIEHLNSIDYGLLCQIASNAPRQILLGERSTAKSSYTLDQILAFRSMFTQITEASNIDTNIPLHLEGKVFQPKKLSTRSFDDIDVEEELSVFEVIAQTLEDLAQSVDDEDIKGKWWMRVFTKLNAELKRSPGMSDDDLTFHTVRNLINGSIMERYRKYPDNTQIVREMKIRLENINKLCLGVDLYIEGFKKYLARTETQMRVDFMEGTTKSVETENERIVQHGQLHRLKSQIQNAFNEKMDGTDSTMPMLINLPMRTRLVMEEITRNLIASGNLLSVEEDQEDEFWENEFRRTIIKTPMPRSGPISLFKQRQRKLLFYKFPWPSARRRRKKRTKGGKGKKNTTRKARPKLADRITRLIDPPKFPLWVGDLTCRFWALVGLVAVATTPMLRIESNLFFLPPAVSLVFVLLADFIKVRRIKARSNRIHPAYARKFQFNLT